MHYAHHDRRIHVHLRKHQDHVHSHHKYGRWCPHDDRESYPRHVDWGHVFGNLRRPLILIHLAPAAFCLPSPSRERERLMAVDYVLPDSNHDLRHLSRHDRLLFYRVPDPYPHFLFCLRSPLDVSIPIHTFASPISRTTNDYMKVRSGPPMRRPLPLIHTQPSPKSRPLPSATRLRRCHGRPRQLGPPRSARLSPKPMGTAGKVAVKRC